MDHHRGRCRSSTLHKAGNQAEFRRRREPCSDPDSPPVVGCLHSCPGTSLKTMRAIVGGYETCLATEETSGAPSSRDRRREPLSISDEAISRKNHFFSGGRGSVEITEKTGTELIKAGGV